MVVFYEIKVFFKKKYSLRYIRVHVINILDPDQARQKVGPDLDPNCLQKSSGEDTCPDKELINIVGQRYLPKFKM